MVENETRRQVHVNYTNNFNKKFQEDQILANRNRMNIVRMILEAARHGATKSKIMHDVYLSSEKTTAYLKLLEDNMLVKCELGNKLYHTTERGFEILDESTELNKLLYKLDPRFSDFDSLGEFSDQLT